MDAGCEGILGLLVSSTCSCNSEASEHSIFAVPYLWESWSEPMLAIQTLCRCWERGEGPSCENRLVEVHDEKSGALWSREREVWW